ncbi:MAG TPA: hypothetical protein VFL78_11465, partial [Rhodanobacteraceae bacterium]|nr:hypothetical protein [Rhodanobacteraceae bacterium]
MHYKKNYLTQALMRLDFQKLSALESDRKPKFVEDISERFPQTKAVEQRQLTVSFGTDIDTQTTKGWAWQCRAASQEKIATLTPDSLHLLYGSGAYNHYPEFR